VCRPRRGVAMNDARPLSEMALATGDAVLRNEVKEFFPAFCEFSALLVYKLGGTDVVAFLSHYGHAAYILSRPAPLHVGDKPEDCCRLYVV